MLAPDVLDEIQRLLAEGKMSQRAIARRLAICRQTVHTIARGRIPKRYRTAPCEEEPSEPCGTAVRCRGCGGMVYPPCRLCGVRALKRRDVHRLTRTTAHSCPERPVRCAGGAPSTTANKLAG